MQILSSQLAADELLGGLKYWGSQTLIPAVSP
jgi:hypothetical protein